MMDTSNDRFTPAVRRLLGMAALASTFAVALPQPAHAQTIAPPSVPPGLEVPAPNQPFLLGRGVGTQNYECQPVDRLGRVDWVLFTPQATLFDDQGEQLTTHFSSPNPDEDSLVRVTWQDSKDTSRVWAKLVAAVTVDPDAIPWVKVEVVGNEPGPNGGNALASTFLQRVNTKGGLAPTTGCDVLSDAGNKAFIPYTADYFFYRK